MHVYFAIFQTANFKLQNGSAIIPADTPGHLCSECPGKYIAGSKGIHSLNFAALKQNVSEENVPVYTLLQVSFKLNCRFFLSVAPQSVLSQAGWESHTEDPWLTHFPNKAGSCEGRAHATAGLTSCGCLWHLRMWHCGHYTSVTVIGTRWAEERKRADPMILPVNI